MLSFARFSGYDEAAPPGTPARERLTAQLAGSIASRRRSLARSRGLRISKPIVDLDRPRFGGQRLVRRLVALPLSFSRGRPATGSRVSSGA
jgi:hypothetical protein